MNIFYIIGVVVVVIVVAGFLLQLTTGSFSCLDDLR
jgi:hypothetical protein